MTRGTAGTGLVVAAAAGALALTGAAEAGTAATLRLKADPGGALKFTKTRLNAAPGLTTIVLKNPSSTGLPHAIKVVGNGAAKRGKTVQPGGTSRVSLKLKAGSYQYFCPVPGHKQAGMKGRLVVK